MLKIITSGILTISLLHASQLHAATDLSSLSVEAQNAITRLCSPVQYREGAAAYRRCVQSEIESQQQGGSNELTTLSFDDKYAVQQFCADAGDSHQSCVSKQVASVRNIPAPTMDDIADDEQYAIQQSCFSAQSTQGLLAYRQCVSNEVASLQQLPRIELGGMPVLERNALQLRCSANSKTASAYRQCLAVEFASFSNAAPTYQTPSTAQTAPQTPVEQVTSPVVAIEAPTQVAEAPDTATQASNQPVITTATALPVSNTLPRNIDPQRATDTQGSIPELEAIPTPETTNAESSTTTLTVTGDNAVNSSAISLTEIDITTTDTDTDTDPVLSSNTAAATTTETPKPTTEPRVISKPKLVEQVAQIEADINNDATSEATPGAGLVKLFGSVSDSIKHKFDSLTALGKAVAAAVLAIPFLLFALRKFLRRSREPQNEQWNNDYQAQPIPNTIRPKSRNTEAIKARWDDDFLNDETLTAQPTQPYVAKPVVKPTQDTTATRIVQRPKQHTATMQTETRWQSGFGKWLESEAIAERQQHCTEFLIYWMAYGDERYEKELRDRIFTEQNPNQHDLIKRWVLKQDVFAFADAINWLKRNTSKAQQEQILDLLMALLITENTITPNQNILLRILADSWSIGTTALQERFKHTFAHDLPAFPRADKRSWWTEQSAETIMRWDARQIAKLPEFEQLLFRLGLNEDYTESDVVRSFRRAAQRCHPDRFSQLGKWEQSLAARQFERFEEARDKLLGVSV